MTKRFVAILGTATTLSLIALGGWLMSQPKPAVAVADNEIEWLTDVKKAQEIAAKEHKDLLINFTGSDWCGWCIRLRDEVFSKSEFEKALNNFVLVEMDFPQNEKLVSPETRKQNQEWGNRLGIEGYPTIVLTDAKGRPYGSLGYVQGGPPAFLSQLNKIHKIHATRDELFAKAKEAKGVDKAKLLASALEAIPEEYLLPAYRPEVQEIIALDGQDQAGLKSKFAKALQQSDTKERLKTLQTEVRLAYGKGGADAALKVVQDALKAKDTQANPLLKSSLVQAEVSLLIQFEKTKQALARLGELGKDKSFTKDEQRSFRERQASLLKEDGQTDAALKAYDALIAEADGSAKTEFVYLAEKAEILKAANRPQEAMEIYSTLLKKTEKGSDEWMTVQLNRGNLLKKEKKGMESGGVFDEMLTVKSLVPVQKAMLLVYAAEAYHAGQDLEETAARIKKADVILKELDKSAEIPPQFLEQLGDRLNAVRKEGKPEKKKTEAKESTKE